jgi:hypothetical protein
MAYVFSLARVGCLVASLAVTGLVACGGDDDGEQAACVPAAQPACDASINIDFESLHTNLLSQRCGTNGGGCHGANATQGNLVLTTPDAAYAALLGLDGTSSRVVAGDPTCSLLMQRLETDDAEKRMPRFENKLPEGLRCAVRQWIEQGAAR